MINMFHKYAFFKSQWEDIETIVKDNYAYDDQDLIIIADHHRHEISYIKSLYPGHKKIIVYQTEPLVESHWWSIDFIVNKLKQCDEVWDYDLDNIEILKTYGIEAKFRPFIYSESLKRIKNKKNKDIDVLFYGTLNERRYKILSPILDFLHGSLKIVFLNNICGKELDHYISRSKIILNLNAHDFDRQKQSRISYCLINNKCVISEKSSRNYFDDCIVETEIENLGWELWNYIRNDTWKMFENVSDRYKEISNTTKLLTL